MAGGRPFVAIKVLSFEIGISRKRGGRGERERKRAPQTKWKIRCKLVELRQKKKKNVI